MSDYYKNNDSGLLKGQHQHHLGHIASVTNSSTPDVGLYTPSIFRKVRKMVNLLKSAQFISIYYYHYYP